MSPTDLSSRAAHAALEARYLSGDEPGALERLLSEPWPLDPRVPVHALRDAERMPAESLRALFARIDLAGLDYQLASQLARRVAALPEQPRSSLGFPRRKVAVLGDVTTDYLGPLLEVALLARGVDASVRVGGFGQLEELVLDPGSWLAELGPDVVVVLGSSLALPGRPADTWRDFLERRRELAREISTRLGADAVLTTLELLPEHTGPAGAPAWLAAYNTELRRGLPERAFVFDLAAVAAEDGVDRWFDQRLWSLARQSVHLSRLPKLADRLAGFLRALDEPPVKLIVTDLDNTLWGGTVAEIGAQAVELDGNGNGPAYARLQHFLRDRVEQGFMLAVCSKNTDEAARSPFEQRPEMVLRLEDFVAIEISFLPKSSVLPELAKQLNVGLQNVLFLDDEAHERLEMRQRWPEVIVPDWPEDGIAGLPALLARSGWLERPRLTPEDEQRLGYYRAEGKRRVAKAAFGDIDEFLRSLDLRARFAPIGPDNLERVTQLVQKTNQFNLTTFRRTRRELEELSSLPGAYAQAVHVEDRNGPFGLTGVIVAVPKQAAVVVDLWLMSCRVMGKTVELAMFDHLLRHARSAGYEEIVALFRPTEKNGAIAGLLPEIGFDLSREDEEGRWYVFPVDAEPKRSSHVRQVETSEGEGAPNDGP